MKANFEIEPAQTEQTVGQRVADAVGDPVFLVKAAVGAGVAAVVFGLISNIFDG